MAHQLPDLQLADLRRDQLLGTFAAQGVSQAVAQPVEQRNAASDHLAESLVSRYLVNMNLFVMSFSFMPIEGPQVLIVRGGIKLALCCSIHHIVAVDSNVGRLAWGWVDALQCPDHCIEICPWHSLLPAREGPS